MSINNDPITLPGVTVSGCYIKDLAEQIGRLAALATSDIFAYRYSRNCGIRALMDVESLKDNVLIPTCGDKRDKLYFILLRLQLCIDATKIEFPIGGGGPLPPNPIIVVGGGGGFVKLPNVTTTINICKNSFHFKTYISAEGNTLYSGGWQIAGVKNIHFNFKSTSPQYPDVQIDFPILYFGLPIKRYNETVYSYEDAQTISANAVHSAEIATYVAYKKWSKKCKNFVRCIL